MGQPHDKDHPMISHLTVVADHTPGHHQTDSPEIQWWWPILGPTASNLAGLLAASARTGNVTWPVAVLAGRLGVHDRIARQAIERLDLFHVRVVRRGLPAGRSVMGGILTPASGSTLAWLSQHRPKAWRLAHSVRVHPNTPSRFREPVVHVFNRHETFMAGYSPWRACTGLVWVNRSVIVGWSNGQPTAETFARHGHPLQSVISLDSDAAVIGSTVMVDVADTDLDAEIIDLWWPARPCISRSTRTAR
jgi:hypothetical protein